MNILITGADGYIGKSLCNQLTDNNLTCIDRKICDLTDFNQVNDFFNGKYFDVVIHCAASGGSRLEKDNDDEIIRIHTTHDDGP